MFAPSAVYSYSHHSSATDEDDGSAASLQNMDPVEGQCMVCGDRSAGKHYGVMACYGCKGFFRRTIRSAQTYSCRFQQKCSIDKDQRNACRFCRFQRCLNVGMEPEAIRPDRDVIGKQKNPRKKKVKTEDSSLPSPGSESPVSNNEESILSFLLDVEEQASCGNQSTTIPIGISMIKSDPDFDASTLFHSQFIRNQESFQIGYAVGRSASVEKLIAALRRYVLSAVHWIDALFGLANVSEVPEKVALLKSIIGPYTVFNIAARTAQISDGDLICLCNNSTVSRQPARHLLDTNLVGNNFVGRVIDDLVIPTKKLALSTNEITILSALIVLDPDARGLSTETSKALSSIRDRVQNALFNLIRDASNNMQNVTSRFGNLLLLFPPLAKLSSLIGENVQLAKMFGISIDSLLVELYADVDSPEVISNSGSSREKTDVSTQTHGDGNENEIKEEVEDATKSSDEHRQHQPNLTAADILGLLPNFDVVNQQSTAYNPFYFHNNMTSTSTASSDCITSNFITPHSAPPISNNSSLNGGYQPNNVVGLNSAFFESSPSTGIVQQQPFRFV